MITITPQQTAAYRKALRESSDANMHTDVGYFIVWYSAAELALTALLAVASGCKEIGTFDTLCSGMDSRVKIERLRKILKAGNGIGPNLDARLRHLDDKARPIRNRIAHSMLGRSENGPDRYFASSLGSMPWRELNDEPPSFATRPPIVITPEELLGWGAWFAQFAQDLSAAFNLATQTGEFEIKNPLTSVPQANQGTPYPAKRPTKSHKRTEIESK